MSFRVSFIRKDKLESVIFPNKELAEKYAKTIPNSSVEQININVPDVKIKKLGTKDVENAKRKALGKEKEWVKLASKVSEKEIIETLCESDIPPSKIKNECSNGCGKFLSKGRTMCFTCSRYQ